MSDPRTALLLGSTGLVGGHVLGLLARDDHWGRIITLGRREMVSISPIHEHHVVDFDDMDVHVEHFAANDVFCCLGTTIKQAGTREAFRRVDFDYPVEAAYLAHAQGASQYLLVSSLGANSKSPVFYSRVKGELEQTLRDVGFDSLSIFRPSLLTGERTDARRSEVMWALGLSLATPLLVGPFRKYRATPATGLSQVMVDVATASESGTGVYEADEIMARARET